MLFDPMSAWPEYLFLLVAVPECYTKVAEAQFPVVLICFLKITATELKFFNYDDNYTSDLCVQIKVEDFFNYFFSDNAVNFMESFHKSCGDKGRKLGTKQDLYILNIYFFSFSNFLSLIFMGDQFIHFMFFSSVMLYFLEFKCNSWYPHENFGHARDVSFQHPIKIYFGMAMHLFSLHGKSVLSIT